MNHFLIKADSVQDNSSRATGPATVLRIYEDFTLLAFPTYETIFCSRLFTQEEQ